MTKCEHRTMRELLEAVLEAVDMDATGPWLGEAVNAATMMLDEAEAEGLSRNAAEDDARWSCDELPAPASGKGR